MTAPRRDRYAMVPESLIYQLEADCLQLYSYLDLVQGTDGYSARNYSTIAEALGWQPRTVQRHAKHLEGLGVVRIEREPGCAAVLHVLHNPARGRLGPDASLDPIDRKTPPRAGTRAGHRTGRQSRSDAAMDDWKARVARATETRVPRGRDTRSTQVELGAPTRAGRAAPQVLEGSERCSGPERGDDAGTSPLRETTVHEFAPSVETCRGHGCSEIATHDGWCAGCEPF